MVQKRFTVDRLTIKSLKIITNMKLLSKKKYYYYYCLKEEYYNKK